MMWCCIKIFERRAMEIVPMKIDVGEGKAWQEICGFSREDVCRRTDSVYDEKASAYILRCFGIDFRVDPCEMKIDCPCSEGALFLDKLKTFLRPTVLCYMARAKDIPPTGRLLRPVDVKGGHRFSAGTHVLPLDGIASRYARNEEGFIVRGKVFGAEILAGYGGCLLQALPPAMGPSDVGIVAAGRRVPPKGGTLLRLDLRISAFTLRHHLGFSPNVRCCDDRELISSQSTIGVRSRIYAFPAALSLSPIMPLS